MSSSCGFVWKCWVNIPNYSHLIGIMISKTIGFRGTLFSDTPMSSTCYQPASLTSHGVVGAAFMNDEGCAQGCWICGGSCPWLRSWAIRWWRFLMETAVHHFWGANIWSSQCLLTSANHLLVKSQVSGFFYSCHSSLQFCCASFYANVCVADPARDMLKQR